MTDTALREINKAALVRIEVYSDCETADLKVMTPVTATGERDPERPLKFFSSVNVVFGGRPYPCNFEIPAASLEQAIDWFPQEARKASEKMLTELDAQKIKRSIIMPSGQAAH